MSKIKIAINGYGRIGRNVLRALFESKRTNEFEIVAVNDLGDDLDVQALITQRDTVQGYFNHEVKVLENGLTIDGHFIRFLAERDPKNLPWKDLGVDVVMECTGVFNSKAKASAHIVAGAKRVVLSARRQRC